MTALYYTLGVLIFAVAIMASIGLHEFGHLIPAKKFGGKVTQWFVGFGPTVWSKKIGETEYGVKAIPLGGYVKIVGMLPPAKGETDDSRVRKSNTGMFTQLISDARPSGSTSAPRTATGCSTSGRGGRRSS
ncbi:site-2 protease family protein [Nocardioides sp. B-3]|uniref:site-2 protease family protein n=1 Tax=Nocardioides sp. B-3 TaxID=2895565 RepID=UPI002153844F|nr:site-2 protease family protein [Nocardioides sp. B-3]UUZ59792.1 site-2 protease family protein [Nocardioides sp. B-3]